MSLPGAKAAVQMYLGREISWNAYTGFNAGSQGNAPPAGGAIPADPSIRGLLEPVIGDNPTASISELVGYGIGWAINSVAGLFNTLDGDTNGATDFIDPI